MFLHHVQTDTVQIHNVSPDLSVCVMGLTLQHVRHYSALVHRLKNEINVADVSTFSLLEFILKKKKKKEIESTESKHIIKICCLVVTNYSQVSVNVYVTLFSHKWGQTQLKHTFS